MSVIASFHTLSADRAPQLPAAAASDDWYDYLNRHGRERVLDAGGRLVWDLDDYAETQGLSRIHKLGDPALTAACARHGSVVFDRPQAARAATLLASLRPITAADLAADYPDPAAAGVDFPTWAQSIERTRQELIAWLADVGESEIGILSVG